MKKLFFSLLASVIVGLMSVNAQSKTPNGFTSLQDVEIGRISSYAGPCMSGPGVCSGTISSNPRNFEVALMKSSESLITFAFTIDFYRQNIDALKNGLVIGKAFSLPKDVSEKIGFREEFVVSEGTYKLDLRDNVYYATFPRVK